MKRELFENYVNDGIRNRILLSQYEKIINMGHELFHEIPPGDLTWDRIDVNIHQKQQVRNAYIVSELSVSADFNEFWQVIWKENAQNIVLITDANDEQQQQKVRKYFPERGVSIFGGNILVQFVSCVSYSDYEEREFRISCQHFYKEITLLSFISWIVDSTVSSLTVTPFLRKMLLISHSANSRIAVVTSGDKKTLGFVLLCIISLHSDNVDIERAFFELRKYQISISASQYILAHFVILENLIHNECQSFETCLSVGSLETMDFRLQFMKKLLWLDRCVEALKRIGEDKEALNDALSAICEPETEHEYTYIDNQRIQVISGPRSPSRFITTPEPRKHSVSSFWKLVIEENVKVIVSLNASSESRSHCWWPNDNKKPLNLSDDIHVHYQTKKQFKIYSWVTVSLDKEENTVDIFLVRNWPENSDCPDSIKDFVNFIIETKRIVQNSPSLMVTCCDGKRASGLYLALSFALEKAMFDGTSDIYSTMRFIKSHHNGFLKTDKQFRFLWEATEIFLKESQNYLSVY